MPDFDNSERLQRFGNEKRILKDDGAPNAARDGFTTIARRVRGDLPGYFTDVGQADAYDKEMADMEGEGGPGSYASPY